MSNLRTEQPVFETDRITDGFDIFFWVFNDASVWQQNCRPLV